MLAHVLRQVPGHTSINQLHSGSMYYKAAGSMRDNASTMCGASWLASGGTKWYAYVLDVGTLPSLSYPHKGCNQPTLNPYMCQCTDNGLATKRYNKECNTALGDSDCTLDPGYVTAQYNMVGCAVIALALFASTCFKWGAYHARPALIKLGCGGKFSQHEMVQRSMIYMWLGRRLSCNGCHRQGRNTLKRIRHTS